MRILRFALGLAALVIGSLPAAAQFGPGAGGRAPYASQAPQKNEPGRFDYYALVLSWSPTYCDTLPRNGYDPQCHSRDGKRFSFVLHGLWPQYDRGWPENCPVRNNFVPQSEVNRMLDIMPSPKLVIHEFKKHGVCSGLEPSRYFDLARSLYSKVKIPARFDRPNQPFSVSPREVVEAFAEANPGLKRDSIAVVCGGPGNRLREVRLCVSKDGHPRDCGGNESPRKLCSADRMAVPPVRGR